MTTLRDLQYVIEANTQGLNKAFPALDKMVAALDRLEKSVNRSGQSVQTQMTKAGNAASASAKQVTNAADKIKARLKRQEAAAISAQQKMIDLNKAIKDAGAPSLLLANTTRAFSNLEKALKNTKLTTAEVTLAKAKFNKAIATSRTALKDFTSAQNTSNSAQKSTDSIMLRQANTLERMRVRYLDLSAALKEAGETEKLKELESAFQTLETSMTSGTLKADEYAQAVNGINGELARIKRSMRHAEGLRGTFNELTKSAQIALGPLSGVASRMGNLASLASTTSIVVAGAVGTIIGLGAAFTKSVISGAAFEKQLLRIKGVLDVTGNAAIITSKRAEIVIRNVTNSTTALQSDVRDAAAGLLLIQGMNEDLLKQSLLISQGLSVVGGGTIESTYRNLAQVLQDPAQGFQTLTQYGVSFTASEKERITTLEESGKRTEALALVLDKLSGHVVTATSESKGLSGQWHKMGEAITNVSQDFATQSGIVETISGWLEGVTTLIYDLGGGFDALAYKIAKFRGVNVQARTDAISLIRNLIDLDEQLNKKGMNNTQVDEYRKALQILKERILEVRNTNLEPDINVDGIVKAFKAIEEGNIDKAIDALEEAAVTQNAAAKAAQEHANKVKFAGDIYARLKEEVQSAVAAHDGLGRKLSSVDSNFDLIKESLMAGGKSAEQAEAAIRLLKMTLQATGSPIASFVDGLERSTQLAQMDANITSALGVEKRKLALEQAVLNSLWDSGYVTSSNFQDALVELANDGYGHLADKIREAVTANEGATFDVNMSGMKKALEDQVAAAKVAGRVALSSSREQAVAIAVAAKQQELLNGGAEVGGKHWKEQLALVRELAGIEFSNEVVKSQKELEDQVKATRVATSVAGSSMLDQAMAIAVAAKEQEMLNQGIRQTDDAWEKQINFVKEMTKLEFKGELIKAQKDLENQVKAAGTANKVAGRSAHEQAMAIAVAAKEQEMLNQGVEKSEPYWKEQIRLVEQLTNLEFSSELINAQKELQDEVAMTAVANSVATASSLDQALAIAEATKSQEMMNRGVREGSSYWNEQIRLAQEMVRLDFTANLKKAQKQLEDQVATAETANEVARSSQLDQAMAIAVAAKEQQMANDGVEEGNAYWNEQIRLVKKLVGIDFSTQITKGVKELEDRVALTKKAAEVARASSYEQSVASAIAAKEQEMINQGLKDTDAAWKEQIRLVKEFEATNFSIELVKAQKELEDQAEMTAVATSVAARNAREQALAIALAAKMQEMLNRGVEVGGEHWEEQLRLIREINNLEFVGNLIKAQKDLEDQIKLANVAMKVATASAHEQAMAIALAAKMQQMYNDGVEVGGKFWNEQLRLVRELNNIEFMTDVIKSQKELEDQVKLAKVATDAATQSALDQAMAIALAAKMQEMLNRGIEVGGQFWNEQLRLVRELVNLDFSRDSNEAIKGMREELKIQDAVMDSMFMSERTRSRAVALAEKQVELEAKYGSLLNENAQKELKVFEQLQARDEIIQQWQEVADAIDDAFSELEDSIVEFVKTGEFNFAKLASSILEDIFRITLRATILDPLHNWLGGLMNNLVGAVGGGLPGGATGGLFDAVGATPATPAYVYVLNDLLPGLSEGGIQDLITQRISSAFGDGLESAGSGAPFLDHILGTGKGDRLNFDPITSRINEVFKASSVGQDFTKPFIDHLTGLGTSIESMVKETGSTVDMIIRSATKYGIDPSVALRVAKTEGGLGDFLQSRVMKNGLREPSFGAFQLLKGGPGTGFPAGMGNDFMAATGLDPALEANHAATIDFAMKQAAQKGWGAWFGAAKAGIGKFEGIPGGGARGLIDPMTTSSITKLGEAASNTTQSISGLGPEFDKWLNLRPPSENLNDITGDNFLNKLQHKIDTTLAKGFPELNQIKDWWNDTGVTSPTIDKMLSGMENPMPIDWMKQGFMGPANAKFFDFGQGFGPLMDTSQGFPGIGMTNGIGIPGSIPFGNMMPGSMPMSGGVFGAGAITPTMGLAGTGSTLPDVLGTGALTPSMGLGMGDAGLSQLAASVQQANASFTQLSDGLPQLTQSLTSGLDKAATSAADLAENGLNRAASGMTNLADNALANAVTSQITTTAATTQMGTQSVVASAGVTQLGTAAMTAAAQMQAGGAIGAIMHGGGIVGGSGGYAMMGGSFAGAPRLHGGLQPNEFKAILKRGEGVFTEDQMEALGNAINERGEPAEGGNDNSFRRRNIGGITVHLHGVKDFDSFNKSKSQFNAGISSAIRQAEQRQN